jgi:DnaK suppressor protein
MAAVRTKKRDQPAAAGVLPDRPGRARSDGETEQIRALLQDRYDELCLEFDEATVAVEAMRLEQNTDRAGDDEVDSGTKASERERALSLIHSIAERRRQVEYAMVRLSDGGYGWCERCGAAIAVERLAVFPSATSCVACQELAERRVA